MLVRAEEYCRINCNVIEMKWELLNTANKVKK